jgi:Ca2+-transporting ATPase
MAGAYAGLSREKLWQRWPEVREEAFDPDVKMMATVHADDHRYRVAVKGAPEAVFEVCTRLQTSAGEHDLCAAQRQEWRERSNALAAQGLRLLALATKTVDAAATPPYADLTLLGLVGLLDPPRQDVRAAITACQDAGIRVVMVTGDQPVTAQHIGRAVGLLPAAPEEIILGTELRLPEALSAQERERLLHGRIFARVSPRQKLDLIALHQHHGAVVAMTGDGVNDAPALKKADIGIAMGQRGMQVAREAADMVLRDDAFATIVAAVEQGRVIFINIRTFVLYLLSCNVSEVMLVALMSALNAPLPILPLQILFLNLVTDVFPALALGVGEGEHGIMQQPPRHPREPMLTRVHWLMIAGYGGLITLAVLGAFGLAFTWLGLAEPQAVSLAFLTLAFAQLLHVFNMRQPGAALLHNTITHNPYIWGALAFCTGLLLAAVYMPGLATVLRVVHPGIGGWLVVVTMSVMPALVGQVGRLKR